MQIEISSHTSSRNFILTAGLLLYCGAFAILLSNKSFDTTGVVVVLIAFGVALPLIAWITTRHAIPLSISIQSGAPEVIVLFGYVVTVSLYLIGGPQWIDQHLPKACNKRLAVQMLARWETEVFEGRFHLPRSTPPTFEEWAEAFLTRVEYANTRKRYVASIRKLKQKFAHGFSSLPMRY